MFCSFITGIVAPCGPSMGVLPVMNFCPLWAVHGCPPRNEFLLPVGRWGLSSPRGSHASCGPFWWVVLSGGSHALCGACGGLSSPWGNFAPCGTLYTLTHITISALPLARPNCIGFNLQSRHLPDYFIGFSLLPCHLPDFIAWVSVYNAATVILLHWFARLYLHLQLCNLPDFISLVSVQSCHSSNLTALVSVYSRATG